MAKSSEDMAATAEEFSFLDLQNCSPTTKGFLLALIENEDSKKQASKEIVPISGQVSEEQNIPQQQPISQPQQVPQPQQQHFNQQIYPTPPTSQPYVYINNVTANVNVHHGTPPNVGEQPQLKPQMGPPNTGLAASGFPPPPPNPMFANPPGLIPTNAVPYLYQHQFAPMNKGPHGPHTPVSVNAPPHAYMPYLIHLPYALPVSQPHVPVSTAVPAPRPPGIMRNSPPAIIPISTAPNQAPNEAFYPQNIQNQQNQPQQIQPPPQQQKQPAIQETESIPKVDEKQKVVKDKIETPVISETKIQNHKPVEKEEKVAVTPMPTEVEKTKEHKKEKQEHKPTEKETPAEAQDKKEVSSKTAFKETKDTNEHEDVSKQNSNGGNKSWASLFHKDTPPNVTTATVKPMARIQPIQNEMNKQTVDNDAKVKNDVSMGHLKKHNNPNDLDMAKFFQSYVMNHRSSMIKPRGLSNRNNWCFVNAILQALVACPTFYNLVKSLPEEPLKKASMAKFTKAIHGFVAEFAPLDHFPKLNRRDKGKKNEDLPVGMTFEASSIFQLLLSLNSDTFKVEEGRQEDAEEFLTFLLNELNDEMLALLKLLVIEDEEEETNEGLEEDEDNDEWHEVGAKNKSLLTRRVGGSNVSLKTPLGSIFQGQLQSCVQLSNGEPTATLQPFFTLPLDIQSKNIKNVSDALIQNFTSEALHGYVCPKTKKEIEASRSLYLDELPSVLILHLKRFIYDDSGSQKLLKNIDFPVDLEIPKEILSSNSRNKYHHKQRSYKLFAVVYHNGKEATLGHYVTDVYHAGLGWLHCDDSIIKSMTESMVLAHSANSVPYILFYRRGDTMGQGSNVGTNANAGGAK